MNLLLPLPSVPILTTTSTVQLHSTNFYLSQPTEVRVEHSTPCHHHLLLETPTSTTSINHRQIALSTMEAVAVLSTKPTTRDTSLEQQCPDMATAPEISPSRRSLAKASTTLALNWSIMQLLLQLPAWPMLSAAVRPSSALQFPLAKVVIMLLLASTVNSTDILFPSNSSSFTLYFPFFLFFSFSTGALFVSFSSNLFSKLANTFNQQ